jgi:hypothetical protein
MTHDTGLAPNPFFGICSLAVCTPNHMNANLNPGDWVLGHTTSANQRRLVYAMRLTRVLDMSTYFREFPQKRPKVCGRPEERCGDNMYDCSDGHWTRMPSVHHNNPSAFEQDINHKVYLAEDETNFWYFGGNNQSSFVLEFSDHFPSLVQERQGFSYIYDKTVIQEFTQWLSKQSAPGLRGYPRDSVPEADDKYLIQIEPTTTWIQQEELQSFSSLNTLSNFNSDPRKVKRGCGPSL